jgi:hypothetical protein
LSIRYSIGHHFIGNISRSIKGTGGSWIVQTDKPNIRQAKGFMLLSKIDKSKASAAATRAGSESDEREINSRAKQIVWERR